MNTNQGAADGFIEISVLLPTYGRPDDLPRALASLARQTLDPARFEVVVVPNGPPAEAHEALRRARDRHPALRLREVVSHRPGVAHARAVGVQAARGRWMTMLDDDDWLSPAYLERLLEAAAPGVVPLADIADVHEPGGQPDFDNSYSVAFRRRKGEHVPAEEIPEAISLNVCKLVPTAIARESGFDTRLRSASDTLFWLGVLSRCGWIFHVLEADDAVYHRVRGHGSLSRQDLSVDFSVVRRLEGLRSLAEVPCTRQALEPLLERTARSLSTHVRRFVTAQPELRGQVVTMAEEFGPPRVDWRTVNHGTACQLLVMPHPDPAAAEVQTALRRVRERSEPVDILSVESPGHLRNGGDGVIAQPWLGRLLGMPVRTSQPASLDAYVTWLLSRVNHLAGLGQPYTVLRSTTGAASQAAAAAVAAARPELRWIADVDPATVRPATLANADELIVCSAVELDALLGLPGDPGTTARLRKAARVEPLSSVPDRLWRGAAQVLIDQSATSDKALLAHVGDLATTQIPALATVVHALPAALRHRTQVVVSSAATELVRDAAHSAGLADVVRVTPLPTLLQSLDLLDHATVALVASTAPTLLASEVAAHPHVVDLLDPDAGDRLVAAVAEQLGGPQ